jgi:hypothetical protein
MQARSAVRADSHRREGRLVASQSWVSAGLDGPIADVLALVVLALLPRLYFWRLLTDHPADQMTIAEGDFTQEYFPVLVTAARSLADGVFPFWNPYSNGGQPLLADPQAALLYPLTWLALSEIRGFDGASFLAMEGLVPLHFSLAGAFSYLAGRVLLGSRIGAAVAAVTFTYSGYFTSFPVQQLPILRTVTWLPLQVLLLWLAVHRRDLRWCLAGGVAFGVAVLAGHPQTAFLEAVGLTLCALTWTWQEAARTRRWPRRSVLALGVVIGVGAGLSAVQWVPTLEFMRLSSRQAVGYDYLSAGFSLWEVPLDLLAPRVLGGLAPYVGLLPLVLAGVAMWVRRSQHVPMAAVLGLAGLLLSLGGHTFLYPLLYQLAPGFDLFRHQERAIFLFTFGIALLAGIGATVVCGRVSRRERWRTVQVVWVAAVGLVGLAALSIAAYAGQLSAEVSGQGVQRWREMVHWLFFAVLMLGLAIGVVLARARVRSLRAAMPGLLLALIALDLLTVSWEANLERRRPDEVYRPSEIVKRLQADVGLARVDDRGVLNGNHGLVYGIPSVTQSFILHLARLEEAGFRLPQARLYDLLNVEFVVAREARPEFGEVIWREQFRDVTNLLFRRSAFGAARVVPVAQPVRDPQEAWDLIAQADFDPREVVVLETPLDRELGRGGSGAVARYERRWDRVYASVSAPTGGYLVMSEMAYPGWTASVDGVDAELLRANALLRGLWLPPGDHEVALRFEPTSVRIGALVSAGATALVLVWLLLPLARNIQANGARRRPATTRAGSALK